MRTLAVGGVGGLGAVAAFGLAVGGPAWLNGAAAGLAAVSGLMAVFFDVAGRRARSRSRDGQVHARVGRPAGVRRAGIDELADDARIVFVSYAREDEDWRRRFETMLRPLGNRGLKVWSDERIAAGSAWRPQLERAIQRADAALVLVTPDLLASEFIMGEELPALVAREIPLAFVHVRASMFEGIDVLADAQWAHDRDMPVASARDPDGEIVRACRRLVELLPVAEPQRATRVYGRGRRSAPRAVRLQRMTEPGELHDVPPPPPELVERDELGTLREALLREGDGMVGITGHRIGLYGQGGIGKTVLAVSLARDEQLRRHFPDGVFWVTVGQHGNLVALQIGLLERLGASRPNLRSVDAGAELLRETLAERRCLLIVDDVWKASAAAAFGVVGSRGRVLYTTRDVAVLESVGADVQRVDVLPEQAARTLLAQLTATQVDALPRDADRVLAATGRVALAVALVGAAVGRGGRSWEQTAAALERGGETFLDHPYADVFKAMQVGVAALDAELGGAYRTLAVYPEDTRVPVAAVARLWSQINDTASERTRAQLEQLAARELLVLDGDAIVFHDLQHDFLLLRAGDMWLLHEDLLAAYRELLPAVDARWCRLPLREPYIWEHLLEHLRGAGDAIGMRAAVTDLAYLATRCFRDGPYAAESDLRTAARLYDEDEAIHRLVALFSRWGHLFAGLASVEDVACALALRMQSPPAPLSIADLRALTAAPLLTPRWGLPSDSDALLRVLGGHEGPVRGVAFSPDGRTLASAGDDGTVRLWDPVSGGQSAVLEGTRGPVRGVAFAPDGRTLASAGDDGTVRLWELATGALTAALVKDHRGPVRGVAFAPDGLTLASAYDDGIVELWDVARSAPTAVFEDHHGRVEVVAFAPNQRTLVSAGRDGMVRLWDPACGTPTGPGWAPARDGSHSVTQGPLRVLGEHDGPVWDVAFASDGRALASSGDDGTVRLWDPKTGASDGALEGHSGAVRAVAFSPDGLTLASASDDGTVRLWDPGIGASDGAFEGHSGAVRAVAFSPDALTLASASDDRTVRLWDVASGALEAVLNAHRGTVRGVAFSPDGCTLASAGDGGTVRLWNATSGEAVRVLRGHRSSVSAVTFSPDGRTLASAGDDWTVRLWNATSGEAVRVLWGHRSSVSAVTFSPDGRTLASAGDDETVRQWDIAAGIQTAVLEGHNGPVRAIAFSPDGRTLASAGDDETVRQWDIAAGIQTAVLEGHNGPARGLTFNPDGRMLASVGDDGTRLWDARTGALIYRAHVGTPVTAVAWSEKGIAFATDSAAVVLNLLDDAPGACLA